MTRSANGPLKGAFCAERVQAELPAKPRGLKGVIANYKFRIISFMSQNSAHAFVLVPILSEYVVLRLAQIKAL